MKNLIKKIGFGLLAPLSLALSPSALGNPSGIDVESLLEKFGENSKVAGIQAVSKNGEGKVTYNGEVVWEGKVEGQLKAVAKSVGGGDGKYTDNTEFAAVWDGEKLLWENVKGASDELGSMQKMTGDLMKKMLKGHNLEGLWKNKGQKNRGKKDEAKKSHGKKDEAKGGSTNKSDVKKKLKKWKSGEGKSRDI